MRVLHLAVSLVVCLVLGQAASLAVEAQLWVPPAAPRPALPPAAPASSPGLEPSRLAELLDLSPKAPSAAEPPFTLLGTLAPRLASVQSRGARAVHTLAPGDFLDGAEVLAIDRGAVLVRLGDTTTWLTTRPGASTATPGPAIARAEVLRALNDLGSLAAQLHVVPRMEGGQLIGFKLYGASRVPLLVQAGLRDGDVIRSINGLDTTRPGDLAGLLSAAGTLSRVDLELVRDGRPLHHSIALQ